MLKNAQFVHILIKNDAKQRLSVVFSILMPMFHKLCVLEQPPPRMAAFLSLFQRSNFKKSEPL